MGKAKLTPNDVLLYYPNLIGYARFLFMLVAFALAKSNWKVSIISYLLAFVGDVVDGHVARAFNQCKSLVIFPLNSFWLMYFNLFRFQVWGCVRYGYR
jgi:hypothetical protein